jgi:hypothetical protein
MLRSSPRGDFNRCLAKRGSQAALRAVAAGNKPTTGGCALELDYIPFNYGGPSFWPWLNVKLGLQYVHYNRDFCTC